MYINEENINKKCNIDIPEVFHPLQVFGLQHNLHLKEIFWTVM